MVSETTNSHVYPKANEGGETASVAPNPSFPNMEVLGQGRHLQQVR